MGRRLAAGTLLPILCILVALTSCEALDGGRAPGGERGGVRGGDGATTGSTSTKSPDASHGVQHALPRRHRVVASSAVLLTSERHDDRISGQLPDQGEPAAAADTDGEACGSPPGDSAGGGKNSEGFSTKSFVRPKVPSVVACELLAPKSGAVVAAGRAFTATLRVRVSYVPRDVDVDSDGRLIMFALVDEREKVAVLQPPKNVLWYERVETLPSGETHMTIIAGPEDHEAAEAAVSELCVAWALPPDQCRSLSALTHQRVDWRANVLQVRMLRPGEYVESIEGDVGLSSAQGCLSIDGDDDAEACGQLGHMVGEQGIDVAVNVNPGRHRLLFAPRWPAGMLERIGSRPIMSTAVLDVLAVPPGGFRAELLEPAASCLVGTNTSFTIARVPSGLDLSPEELNVSLEDFFGICYHDEVVDPRDSGATKWDGVQGVCIARSVSASEQVDLHWSRSSHAWEVEVPGSEDMTMAHTWAVGLVLHNLVVGRHRIRFWLSQTLDPNDPSRALPALADIQVVEDSQSVFAQSKLSHMVVVSAASERFVPQLRNFVGSVHTWEPGTHIELYDLGLSVSSIEEVRTWKNVKLRDVPMEVLPAHVSDLSTYAFKPWILNHSLSLNEAVLWLDANFELRRALDDVRHSLLVNGTFLVEQRRQLEPVAWPSEQLDFLSSRRQLDCEFPARPRALIAGGIQGYVRGSVGHRLLLHAVLDCAMRKQCIQPQGASRLNHRQDQTVLNAVACALEEKGGVKLHTSSDPGWSLVHGESLVSSEVWPHPNPLEWNDCRLFNRRFSPTLPYQGRIICDEPGLTSAGSAVA